MKYFPVFLDLDNQLVVLVGDADGLTPKLANLLKTDARLMVFVKNSNDYLEKLAANNQIELNTGLPSKDTLASARLVYLDGSQVDIHRQLRSQCQSLNVPVNTVDDAGASDFISAAIIDRDPVVVAVSSSGAAPILVRRIKAQIESLLATETGVVARLANKLRPKAKTALDKTARIAFWRRFFDGLAASRLRQLGFDEARKVFHRELGEGAALDSGPQPVALVGAGPGDPELLTLRARRVLEQADVILYDRLVDPRILDIARREARFIEVGKQPGGKSWHQDEINQAIVEHAKEGNHVVRLKSGDPMIFGRADEEIDAILQADLTYEVVPGITSASAASASIGRSLTRRERNSAFSFLTAQDVNGFAEHDWRALAKPGATSAIYMGVRAARFVQGRLLVHGADPDTPVSVIENASREDERIIDASLGTLQTQLEAHGVVGPAIIFIGLNSRHASAEMSTRVPAAVGA